MQIFSTTQPDLAAAAALIKSGGVLAYPTESVFGLGCDPENAAAIQRLLAIKQREVEKGLILIAANWEQLSPWIQTEGCEIEKIQASWPGPFTWVFPASERVSSWVRGNHLTVAVRIPGHPLARALCEALETPLISTSANRSGQPFLQTAEAVKTEFEMEIEGLIDAPVQNPDGLPSMIRDAKTLAIIRP